MIAGPDEFLRDLDRGVIAQLLGRGDTRIVTADAVARPAVEPVRLHPRSDLRHPELRYRFPIWTNVPEVRDGDRLPVDDFYFHESMIS